MLRRNLGRIAQLAKATLEQQSASFEIISSFQTSIPNQAALSLARSSNFWNLSISWRFYSSENSGDGLPSDDAKSNSVLGTTDANPPTSVPTAAVSTPLDPDAALDAWGDAMDKG